MLKRLIKLSAYIGFAFFCTAAKADSFLLLASQNIYQTEEQNTLPLFFVKELEFHNGETTKAYTNKIKEYLSLNPSIVVTDNESLADYYVFPKLLQSKIDAINKENSRYSISIQISIQTPDKTVVAKKQKNRYIILTKNQNKQEIAQKLLIKLLKEAADSLMSEFKHTIS